MNPYPVYKNSGVPWLGEVPEHWKLSKIKHIANFSPKCTKRDLAPDDFVGYAPMECIKQGYFVPRSIQCQRLPAALVPFDEGDIVMAKVTPCFENGNIAIMEHLPNGIGFGSSELFVLRSTGILKYFLFYWLQNPLFKGAAASTMTGAGGLKRVSPTFVRDSRIPIPPLEEQTVIVAYLNVKCARINELVARRQGIIEKLRELKQAIIARTVTKGLNPHVPMKDSGVDWIGEVPEHWKKFRVKKVVELVTTSSNDPHKIGLENIEGGTGRFHQTDSQFEGNGIQFQVGDIVYGKLRPYLQKVWIAEFPGNAVGDFYVFRSKSVANAQFLRFILLSQRYTDVINSSTYGAKMPRVSSAFILSLACYIPPLEEQAAIAAYLDEKCARIDELILRHERTVEKLKELKAATIAEVVTGKVDVRKKTKQQIS